MSRCWGQGRAIAANPAGILEESGWALIMLTPSTPGTNCFGLETAKVLLVLGCLWLKVFKVKCVSDRIILVKIIVSQQVFCFLFVYAPQCGICAMSNE